MSKSLFTYLFSLSFLLISGFGIAAANNHQSQSDSVNTEFQELLKEFNSGVHYGNKNSECRYSPFSESTFDLYFNEFHSVEEDAQELDALKHLGEQIIFFHKSFLDKFFKTFYGSNSETDYPYFHHVIKFSGPKYIQLCVYRL